MSAHLHIACICGCVVQGPPDPKPAEGTHGHSRSARSKCPDGRRAIAGPIDRPGTWLPAPRTSGPACTRALPVPLLGPRSEDPPDPTYICIQTSRARRTYGTTRTYYHWYAQQSLSSRGPGTGFGFGVVMATRRDSPRSCPFEDPRPWTADRGAVSIKGQTSRTQARRSKTAKRRRTACTSPRTCPRPSVGEDIGLRSAVRSVCLPSSTGAPRSRRTRSASPKPGREREKARTCFKVAVYPGTMHRTLIQPLPIPCAPPKPAPALRKTKERRKGRERDKRPGSRSLGVTDRLVRRRPLGRVLARSEPALGLAVQRALDHFGDRERPFFFPLTAYDLLPDPKVSVPPPPRRTDDLRRKERTHLDSDGKTRHYVRVVDPYPCTSVQRPVDQRRPELLALPFRRDGVFLRVDKRLPHPHKSTRQSLRKKGRERERERATHDRDLDDRRVDHVVEERRDRDHGSVPARADRDGRYSLGRTHERVQRQFAPQLCPHTFSHSDRQRGRPRTHVGSDPDGQLGPPRLKPHQLLDLFLPARPDQRRHDLVPRDPAQGRRRDRPDRPG